MHNAPYRKDLRCKISVDVKAKKMAKKVYQTPLAAQISCNKTGPYNSEHSEYRKSGKKVAEVVEKGRSGECSALCRKALK